MERDRERAKRHESGFYGTRIDDMSKTGEKQKLNERKKERMKGEKTKANASQKCKFDDQT